MASRSKTISPEKQAKNLLEILANEGLEVPEEYLEDIQTHLASINGYEPLVGVFGKTGAGKSSLCNALFGKDVAKISNIRACTREAEEIAVSLGQTGIRLVDVPGIAESEERDEEYFPLYEELLPKLDLVLWVMKGNDRAYEPDLSAYKEIIKPNIGKTPFFIIINQADAIAPKEDWDKRNGQPGLAQRKNIELKRQVVAKYFRIPLANVIVVSSQRKYGLIELVDAIVNALPKNKKGQFASHVAQTTVSEPTKRKAKNAWIGTLSDAVIDVLPIPNTWKPLVKTGVRILIDRIWD